MSSEAAREALEIITAVINADRYGIVVVLGGGLPKDHDIAKMTLEDKVGDEICNGATRWLSQVVDSDLVRYEVGNFYNAESGSSYLAVDELGDSQSLLEVVTNINFIPQYGNDTDLLHSATFLAIILQASDHQVALFKHLTPSFIVNQSRTHWLTYQNDHFSKLDRIVVQFNDNYDCVTAAGHIFIMNRSGFERIFDYGQLKIDHARSVLQEMVEVLAFSVPDKFIEACVGDRRLHKKVESIIRRKVHASVSIAEIEKVCIERELPVAFENNGNGERVIAFDGSRESRKAILALLDDDHVESILTRMPYEATSKRDWLPS